MAGGYSGQMLAMDVNTPSETQLATAQADMAQTQSQLARQSLPAEVQLRQAQAASAQMANQDASLNLQQKIQLNALRQHLLQKSQPTSDAASPAQSPLASTAGADSSPAPAAADSQVAPLFDPQIEKVMQSIDPNDPNASEKWDDAMTGLMDEVPQARQFVGNYSTGNLNNWRGMIGAHGVRAAQSPLATAAAPQSPLAGGAPAASPVAPVVSPITGKVDPDLQAMSIIDPKGTQEYIQMQGMLKYQQTGDMNVLKRFAPEVYEKLATADKAMTETQKDAWGARADQMGRAANAVLWMGAKVGPNSPEAKQAYQAAIIDAAKQGWLPPAEAKARLAAPIDWGWVSTKAVEGATVSEWAKASGQEAQNDARARAANPEPNTQYIGVDAQGRPIYHNTHAGPGTPDTTGNIPVNAKPSAGAATFEAKKAAYIAVHPNDEQGAIEFANGQKTLPPGEAAVAARAAADREQSNAALMGQPFDAQAAYKQHLAEFTGAGAAPAPGPVAPRPATPGTHGTPAPAGKTVADWVKQVPPSQVAPSSPAPMPNPQTVTPKGFTVGQVWRANQFHGTTAPVGTTNHPVVPTSKQQYDKMKSGTVYIDQNGVVRTKA